MSEGSAPGLIFGPWPGEVASYDKISRTCMVRIPGISDGGDVLMRAQIRYPVGDKSKAGENSTDILMLPNDLVWLEFIGGDPRYPLITGQRNPEVGNGTDWRRFHQANIEMLAAQLMQFIAGGNVLIESTGSSIKIKSPSLVTIEAPLTHIKGALTVDNLITGTGGMTVSGGSGAAVEGDMAINGGSLTNNGTNVGSDHLHDHIADGAPVSPPY